MSQRFLLNFNNFKNCTNVVIEKNNTLKAFSQLEYSDYYIRSWSKRESEPSPTVYHMLSGFFPSQEQLAVGLHCNVGSRKTKFVFIGWFCSFRSNFIRAFVISKTNISISGIKLAVESGTLTEVKSRCGNLIYSKGHCRGPGELVAWRQWVTRCHVNPVCVSDVQSWQPSDCF